MGRWSRRLAEPFLDFVGTVDGESVLDVPFGRRGILSFRSSRSVAPLSTILRMTASSKGVRLSKARQEAKLRSTPPAVENRPFLRFYHSGALRKRTLALIGTLELDEDPTRHRDALADLVVELTGSGMDYYFMRSLKLAKPGFLVEQSANLGLVGVQQILQTAIRQIIGRMDSPQLVSVCRSIQQLMR